MKVAIIGAGAAGIFAAINVKNNFPGTEVTIFEKSNKALSKVKVSGGGRCNVTNNAPSQSKLANGYPRGKSFLKKAFKICDNKSIINWFKSKGIELYAQDDGRIFPISNNSQTIIDCFFKELNDFDLKIEYGIKVEEIIKTDFGFKLACVNYDWRFFDKIIVATGGTPKLSGFNWLVNLGHSIVSPVPSLFTFNIPSDAITRLPGVSVENVIVHISGTKLSTSGPVLITHWGMSGPAILKLSAFGARQLASLNYDFELQINWTGVKNHISVLNALQDFSMLHSDKVLGKVKPFNIPKRLWAFLINKVGLNEKKKWGEIGKKGLNKLIHILTNDTYKVKGKTTFKEEFVTCGGVSLEEVDPATMESKICPNLYFCGEVLDIDGITGGYNFQAAWTTAYIAAMLNSNNN